MTRNRRFLLAATSNMPSGKIPFLGTIRTGCVKLSAEDYGHKSIELKTRQASTPLTEALSLIHQKLPGKRQRFIRRAL